MAKITDTKLELDYIIKYECITKAKTKAYYTFKRFKELNDFSKKCNKESERTEKKFIELANKCQWIFTCTIEKVNGE